MDKAERIQEFSEGMLHIRNMPAALLVWGSHVDGVRLIEQFSGNFAGGLANG
ncbi:MAG TPA: hypothetical protein VHX65_13085 [Pirellulales bacterium]|jgi:hypothetical protein|nr:hypothetical protein [Pirellulales bacterium]